MSLPRFRCHKEVEALKIAEIRAGRDDGGGPGATLLATSGRLRVSVSDEWMSKHNPQPDGYYIRYADGYESYSPAEAFETGYTYIGKVK